MFPYHQPGSQADLSCEVDFRRHKIAYMQNNLAVVVCWKSYFRAFNGDLESYKCILITDLIERLASTKKKNFAENSARGSQLYITNLIAQI